MSQKDLEAEFKHLATEFKELKELSLKSMKLLKTSMKNV